MNFPHLDETTFPNIDTVDVYAYRNTFDYTRWNENTRVKLINVIWNGDYSDVVKFDTDTLRDAWFDAVSDAYTVELVQAARIAPDKAIKLPIPYDVLARYNYLYVDMPIATSADAPIDYETTNGILRWYYFIDDVAYLSPNSTSAYLTLDVWTNFQNRVEINYMMLERGHAPVAFSDTDTYLQNPIANNRYLLAPDVNFDNAGITRHSDYVPFGNGEKYVCVASTCAPEQLSTLGTVTEDGSYAPTGTITYSDIDARYGHQLQVNGLTIGNGRNYGNARTPAKAGHSDSGLIPNNLSVYAIPAQDCYGNGTFFADIIASCPQFLNTVHACFVVAGDCLSLGTSHTVAGHTLYECNGTRRNLFTKQLTQNDFNYPTELRRFAKLYTSPYATLEVTDNDGTTFTINIEETSTVQVKSVVSVAFPYIDYRVYLDGIGGVGSQSYSWVDLRGQTSRQEISDSDWFKYCFDWEIPTFALYMDGETAYQLATFNRNTKMGINNALVAYHNTMRSANTALENAGDSADTAHTNTYNSTDTARTNAYNSAETGKTNADNSAVTGKTNADASADTMYTNVDETCYVEDANRIRQQAANLTNLLTSNSTNLEIATRSLDTNEANWWADMAVSAAAIEADANGAATLLETSAMSNVGRGFYSGAMAGMSMGPIGAIASGAIGATLGGVDAMVNGQQQSVAIGVRGEIWDAQQEQGSGKWDRNREFTDFSVTTQNNANAEQLAEASDSTKDQMDRNHDLMRGNAARNRDTQKANATRTRDTLMTNATNTRDTSETNANNVFDTDRTNADNTQTRVKENAGFTRQVEELNAKELLENAANAAMAGINDARNATPVSIGVTQGNPTNDYMQNRGVQIKVKTQSDSAIRQTGDTFARFGYALNQVWNLRESGLKLMRHFTYWKASEIWVDDRESSTNAVQSTITDIFLKGVTVWNNPDEIGRVSVYDN